MLQALMALALIRMNRIVEARQHLDNVMELDPTDDGVLQALTICYKELQERKIKDF